MQNDNSNSITTSNLTTKTDDNENMKENKANIYDTIIIGAGAAGCSAGIYATRYNLKTLLIAGPMPGGLITEALEVENYPGHVSIGGQELGNIFVEQATKLGAEYIIDFVQEIKKSKDNELFEVKTANTTYLGCTVILAMGTHHRKLGVKGEEEFAGRGVSYCATCDAPFFKDKIVAVTGGGNSAVEGVQDIAVHAQKTYLIYRSELKAAPIYIEHMRKNPKIIEVPFTNITEISGDTKVTKVILDKEFEGKNEILVDGVFVQIGYIPNNELPKNMGVKLTRYGYVDVDPGMGTNIKGVFCAGDLSSGSNQLHQQVTSASEGAIAAQSAYRYLQGMEYVIQA